MAGSRARAPAPSRDRGPATAAREASERHGKPVLSCARRHFREFDFIGPYLEEHGLGKIIADDRLFACDWEEDIARVRELSVRGRVPLGGEKEVWSDIENRLA